MRALSAPGREAMMSHLAQSEPDLAILELRLGQDNGLDLLRDIRSRTDVPVIILADERGDDIDRVVGLELGADDCVTTPFGIRELLARAGRTATECQTPCTATGSGARPLPVRRLAARSAQSAPHQPRWCPRPADED